MIHLTAFTSSEGFPITDAGANINDRDYEHDTFAQQSVESDAAKGVDRRALQEMPLVQDGVVLDGNHRDMIKKIASRTGKNTDYIEAMLEETADGKNQWGIPVESVRNLGNRASMSFVVDEVYDEKGESSRQIAI